MRAKTHAWWFGIAITGVLGWGAAWVQNVNATNEAVAIMKTAMPRLETKIDRVEMKQDQTNDRLANIEGRLTR